MVALSCNHFWGSVAGRTACRLQSLPRLVSVTQTEVNDLDVLVVIKKEIFRLEVTMDNVQLVQVLDASDDLVEKGQSFRLLDPLILYDIVEELTATGILHDEIQLLRGLDNLVKLNNVRVTDHLQNVDFPGDAFDIINVLNFVFFKNFDGNLTDQIIKLARMTYSLVCQLVDSKLHLAKRAFSNCLV